MGLLLDWAVQPLSAVLILWLVSLVTAIVVAARTGSHRLRAALGANALAFASLWAAATPTVANALVGSLESMDTDPVRCASDGALPIVVPGADMNAWSPDPSPWRVLGPATLARTLAAAELALAPSSDGSVPDGSASGETARARLYTLGGGDNGRALGALMARVLAERGVDPARVTAETASRSTRDNALELTALLAPDPGGGTRIRLVTSALHLARATAAFEAAGYRVCGVGVASLVSPSAGLPAVLPWTDSLARTSEAAREALATLLYAWRDARAAPARTPS